ncbi:MAG: DUF1059 domain-containing protein [Actinomycetota bacterium]
MAEFKCSYVGADSCKASFSGSKEDILRQVTSHLQSKHRVRNVTQTILNLVAKNVR